MSEYLAIGMTEHHEATDLEELIDQIAIAAHNGDPVSLDMIMDEIGRRSFGPLLLFAGLIAMAPIVGDIPGVPTLLGLFVLITSLQLLLGAEHFWLPQWLLNRSVSQRSLDKSLGYLRRPARWVDRYIRPRWGLLTNRWASNAIAVVCMAVAIAMPIMEFIPFSANGAGAVLSAFGLALIARDGLLAAIAMALTLVTFGFIGYNLM